VIISNILRSTCTIGFSDGAIPAPDHSLVQYRNTYAISTGGYSFEYECVLAGELHQFELPEGGIIPQKKDDATDAFGCGLLLDPQDKLSIFITVNGQLMGELVLKVLKTKKRTH
jgi:hypothetical protein